jgi:8-oxo-dGTP pyrophosphatase MutT (NUDIX family)
MDLNYGKFPDLIRQVFKGTEAPQDFSPRRIIGDLPPDLLPRQPWKPAAVLLPLVIHADMPTVLLTQRTEGLQEHAGQVSFPGGSREQADRDPVETALRETEEEIGLPRDHVEVAGYLDGYLTITGYTVSPVVGLVHPGFKLSVDPLEVAAVFEVPLSFLMDPRNRQVERRALAGRDVGYYVFNYEQHRIWGATAAMLVNFLDKLSVGAKP